MDVVGGRGWPSLSPQSMAGALPVWSGAVYLHILFTWTWLPSSHGYTGLVRNYEDAKEYCEAEHFNPMCQPDAVVVMTAAYYGRMKKGRCAQTDYGFIGCFEDVLRLMDYRCSGRDSCDIRLPDTELDEIKPCPIEFRTYLNASYTCVQVETSPCQMCARSHDNSHQAQLTLPQGYIASWTTKQYEGCGSTICPWLIKAQPGQKINITLYDFSDKSKPQGNSWVPNACNTFGLIKETAAPSNKRICKGQERESHLYTSVSHSVEIHVVSAEVLDKAGQFLLYYEAVGCPDYDPPQNTYVRREDDHLVVGCELTSEKWELHCKGTEWQGDMGTCPGIAPPPVGPISLPLGVLIAIVIGIALVIGVLILTVGIVFLKRQQHELHQRADTTLYVMASQEPDYREDLTETRLVPKYDTSQLTLSQKPPTRVALVPPNVTVATRPPGTAAHGAPRENLYCRRMESRPLPSLPNLAEQPTQQQQPPQQQQQQVQWPPSSSDDDVDRYRVQVHRTGSGREQHCHYQPRVVTKRAHSTGSSSRDDPQYFVLDPDDPVVEEPEGEGGAAVAGASHSASGRIGQKMKEPKQQGAVKLPTAGGSTGGSGSTGGAPVKLPSGGSGSGGGGPPLGKVPSGVPGTAIAAPLPTVMLPGGATQPPPSALPACAPSTSRSKTKPIPPPKPNQKSPEQENVENDSKEVHNVNSSCHEIPLRPSREGSQTSKVPESSNGNSSWP